MGNISDPRRATARAHAAIAPHVNPGDLAADATAGNGHDTTFLANLVGSRGHVWALDIQQAALDSTRSRLAEAGLLDRVDLVLANHRDIASIAPAGLAAVTFNLGYLPGGDHSITTQIDSTCTALTAALHLLRPGGTLTCIAYPTHPGGHAETTAVLNTLLSLNHKSHPFEFAHDPPNTTRPRLVTARRR